MQPVEFAIWAMLAVFTIFFLLNWFLKKRKYKHAILFEQRERIALQAAPLVAIVWAAILLLFLFVGLNTLYLLVVFPLVYIVVFYQVANTITHKDQP